MSSVQSERTPGETYDFSQVRVHTDAKAAESARAVNALAYTVGTDVVCCCSANAPVVSTPGLAMNVPGAAKNDSACNALQ